MIQLRLENNGLIIETDEEKVHTPIITGFLKSFGFVEESDTILKLSGEITPGIVEVISLYLKPHFPNIIINDSAGVEIEKRVQRRTNVENLRTKALGIKSKISDGENFTTTVPRMLNNISLYWYQALAVEHGITIGNSANFSVPGSGKTWMAYSVFFKMKEEKKIVDKLLVIGPKVAYRAWKREYEKITGQTPSITNITGNETQRRNLFTKDSEIFFINYALIPRELPAVKRLLNGHRFLVIADESHHFKNNDTNAAEAMNSIAGLCTQKMILTGTMMPRNVHDVYTQFNFLLSDEAVLPDYDTFKTRFPIDDISSIDGVSDLVNPFFYRVNKPTLKLPPQTFNPPVKIQMFDTQRRIYEQVASWFVTMSEQYRHDAIALAKWKRKGFVFLIDAATDPSLLPTSNQFTKSITDIKNFDLDELLENYEGIEKDDEGKKPRKLMKAIELAKETLNKKEKVVVWCSFVKTIEKLEKLFEAEGIDSRIVYGQVPADEEDDPHDNRSIRIDEFSQGDEVNVLIANPATLAESVSLHEVCHHAIYVDRTFNGGHYMQSLERIHRVGLEKIIPMPDTKYDVIQAELAPGIPSIDYRIDESLQRKKREMDSFLRRAEFGVMKYREESNKKDYEKAYGDGDDVDDDFDVVMKDCRDITSEIN